MNNDKINKEIEILRESIFKVLTRVTPYDNPNELCISYTHECINKVLERKYKASFYDFIYIFSSISMTSIKEIEKDIESKGYNLKVLRIKSVDNEELQIVFSSQEDLKND